MRSPFGRNANPCGLSTVATTPTLKPAGTTIDAGAAEVGAADGVSVGVGVAVGFVVGSAVAGAPEGFGVGVAMEMAPVVGADEAVAARAVVSGVEPDDPPHAARDALNNQTERFTLLGNTLPLLP